MALTANEIVACNAALAQLGHRRIDSSMTTSLEYQLCEQFLPLARDEMLSRHSWNCATVLGMTHRIGRPLWRYEHLYQKPSDCLRVLSLQYAGQPFEVLSTGIATNSGGLPDDWKTETVYSVGDYVQYPTGGVKTTYQCISAHTSTTFLDDASRWNAIGEGVFVLPFWYIRRITDPSAWSPMLYQVIVLRLAIYLSLPLGQEKRVRTDLIVELERSALPTARSVDSHEGVLEDRTIPSWIQSRW